MDYCEVSGVCRGSDEVRRGMYLARQEYPASHRSVRHLNGRARPANQCGMTFNREELTNGSELSAFNGVQRVEVDIRPDRRVRCRGVTNGVNQRSL
ncbi:hypothetical protein D3C72_2314310 [compost metagenome]